MLRMPASNVKPDMVFDSMRIEAEILKILIDKYLHAMFNISDINPHKPKEVSFV